MDQVAKRSERGAQAVCHQMAEPQFCPFFRKWVIPFCLRDNKLGVGSVARKGMVVNIKHRGHRIRTIYELRVKDATLPQALLVSSQLVTGRSGRLDRIPKDPGLDFQ